MRLHSGVNDSVLDWLARRVDFTLAPRTWLIWATSDLDGALLGAIGFGGKMGKVWGSISIALATPRAALPLIRAAVVWAFGVQGSLAGFVTISSRRKPWIEALVCTVGFREVDRVRAGISPREDLVILKLTPATCRVWKQELKKLSRSHALEAS